MDRARVSIGYHADMADTDLLALDRQLCFALVVASRNVIGMYRPVLEPLGLTHPQYLVMLSLWEEDGMSVSALAKRLSLEPATLSPLVKRLEGSGHVRRERRADDERTVGVWLTDEGRALRERATTVPTSIIGALGWSIEDLEALRGTLTRLLDDADRARDRLAAAAQAAEEGATSVVPASRPRAS